MNPVNTPANFKFVALPGLALALALPVPEIIGDTPKIWAVPGYAHAPLSPKF